MRNRIAIAVVAGALIASAPVDAQTPAAGMAFEVASVRQSPPPDMQKLIANLNAGVKPESTHIDGSRAVFTFMSLKRLLAYAYGARTYEISGPDWLSTDRFDIIATLPAGASKDSVPAMMQALLLDRFHLEAHRATLPQQPVLAIVEGKTGAKVKPASASPEPLDLTQPLKPGQAVIETPEGPILLLRNPDGSATYNMGPRGDFSLKFDGETRSMHVTSDAITMNGVAVLINILGGGEGREVVNLTQLPSLYKVSVELSLMDLLGGLHDDGIDLPAPPPGSGGGATDPEGGATLAGSMDRLGLRLEKTHADVPRLVIDKIDKLPTEN